MNCELIDTLWNVNSKVFDEQVGQNIGINRYIMECKSCWCWGGFGWCSRINRYIMECKYRNNMGELLQRTRINRYIMECKSFYVSLHNFETFLN